MTYEEPTLEHVGGDSEFVPGSLGIAFYFAFVVAFFYVAVAFSVGAAETVAAVHAGIEMYSG